LEDKNISVQYYIKQAVLVIIRLTDMEGG